mmetsp:Transcript_19880/g.24540  ORF Transcript_19880/g.24540 Transcript_19880/m.24540 type:complete len:229 (-) Transcript_19880:238-924(-)|eukprot:CAMPEP_0172508378 /NCGR_PEP_ID=MMETSP1066-20121228/211547_1 /TAXON_ID=671091 /ORGANISM="Coscinodiscus wailesii, Strain CCMP2513" /LENGTH=228 /DNA_ID=CAMNT_0013286337 /DNA_START=71 /DNA_END=757 /DNA_ORIENTATION=+
MTISNHKSQRALHRSISIKSFQLVASLSILLPSSNNAFTTTTTPHALLSQKQHVFSTRTTTTLRTVPEGIRTDDNSTIPMLPPIGGGTSSSSLPLDNNTSPLTKLGQKEKTPVAFVGSRKFELQYTCKICNTRNSNKVSRHAYRNGVVISVCKGCQGKHLIADNLGWSNYIGGFDGDENIEEFLENQGRGDEVNRVSKDIWELEELFDEGVTSEDMEGAKGRNGGVFE